MTRFTITTLAVTLALAAGVAVPALAVPVGAGPNGVTVNLDTTTVYTANSIDNTVSVLACGQR